MKRATVNNLVKSEALPRDIPENRSLPPLFIRSHFLFFFSFLSLPYTSRSFKCLNARTRYTRRRRRRGEWQKRAPAPDISARLLIICRPFPLSERLGISSPHCPRV